MLEDCMSSGMTASFDASTLMSITLLLDRTKRLDIKKRGVVQLSIPRVEALALPIIVEQTTSEATPYEVSPYSMLHT